MDWRTIDTAEREQYLSEVSAAIAARTELGHERYGTEFQGDPLEQAWEEALDLLFYLWVEKRKRLAPLQRRVLQEADPTSFFRTLS
jgi:hypothetical protein